MRMRSMRPRSSGEGLSMSTDGEPRARVALRLRLLGVSGTRAAVSRRLIELLVKPIGSGTAVISKRGGNNGVCTSVMGIFARTGEAFEGMTRRLLGVGGGIILPPADMLLGCPIRITFRRA